MLGYKNMRRAVVIGCCLAALTACGGPVISQPGSPMTKIDGFYEYGVAERDLKLVVDGTPFPTLPQADFAKRVELWAAAPSMRQPTHPTLTPGETARSGYQMIFAFQPAVTQTGQGLCSGQIEHGPGASNWLGGNGLEHSGDAAAVSVRAIAAFCVAGVARTEIVGQTDAISPDDPRLPELVGQMVQALFRPDIRDVSGRTTTMP